MKKTAIVMDSTGYLTLDLIDQLNIKVVPLTVNLGNETFPENQLSNAELFTKIEATNMLPTTSQPSVGSFLETYQTLAASGVTEIVSIHLSQAISGTLTSARMAKELLSDLNIQIYDSGASALGLGILAWCAADWAQAGCGAQDIIDNLTLLKPQTEIYFLVDNLDQLHRGGRIGGAAHLFGSLLNIKPILYFNTKGEIDVFDKIRSKSKAWQRVLRELDKALQTGQHYRLCLMHVHSPEEGENLLSQFQQAYPEHEIRLFEAGPVIATHVGPGAIGLVFAPWPFPQGKSC